MVRKEKIEIAHQAIHSMFGVLRADVFNCMLAALDAADSTIPRSPSAPPRKCCRVMLRLKTAPAFYVFGWYNPDAVKGSQWIAEGPTNIDFCDQWIIDWLPEPEVKA